MKTIICKNYQQELIYESLANQTNGVVADVRVIPLSVALDEQHSDGFSSLLLISHVLKKRKDEFPIYEKMFGFPGFIQEIYRFTLECIKYQIQPNTLPTRNEQEVELQRIIDIVYDFDFVEKNNSKNLSQAIDKLQQMDVEVYPHFEADPYYDKILKQLPQSQRTTTEGKKHLRYALSTRREIEAIAQDIAIYKKPCNLVLTSWQSQYPVVQQVFARYEIPFSTVHNDVSTRLLNRYIALVNLAYYKTRDALMSALYIDAFGFDDNRKTSMFSALKYLDQVLVDVKRPQYVSDQLENSALFKKESKRYAYYEQQVDTLFDTIQERLDTLLNANQFEEILMSAFEIVRNEKILQNAHELQMGRSLRAALQSILSVKENELEDIPFVVQMLSAQGNNHSLFTDSICTVTDLTHPVDKKEISYVVGCSGKNYPSFPVHNGLFDEDYLSMIDRYPSMKDRHHRYMHALNWIDQSADEIYYSYSTNDYQGKEMQLAYEIQSKITGVNENIPWSIISVDRYTNVDHNLEEDIAKQLFLDDKQNLYGSVSTVELYYRNPYAYFIQNGLGISEQDFSSLDAITIGNIQHQFMYSLLHACKDSIDDSQELKKYALQRGSDDVLSIEDIKQQLQPYFDELKNTHPNQQYLYDISLERLSVSLHQFLIFMNDMELESNFIPEEFEYRFKESVIGNVCLHGIVDRIDLYQNLMRIIDYKSSILTMSEEAVKQGLKLQMLTYMLIVSKDFNQKQYEPTAIQYISMKDEIIDLNRSYSAYGDLPKQAVLKDLKDEYIKQKKSSVWIFNEHQADVDENAKHIKSPKDQYDFTLIAKYIEGIYANFYQQVLSGNIELSPIEGSSIPYMTMYHFNGEYRKPQSIEVEGIASNEPFKLSKEKIAAKGVKQDEDL